MSVIILRSLSALPFHLAGGDVRLSLDQVILLLSLVDGSIYATASLTMLASGDRDHILSGVFNHFLSEKSEPAE